MRIAVSAIYLTLIMVFPGCSSPAVENGPVSDKTIQSNHFVGDYILDEVIVQVRFGSKGIPFSMYAGRDSLTLHEFDPELGEKDGFPVEIVTTGDWVGTIVRGTFNMLRDATIFGDDSSDPLLIAYRFVFEHPGGYYFFVFGQGMQVQKHKEES